MDRRREEDGEKEGRDGMMKDRDDVRWDGQRLCDSCVFCFAVGPEKEKENYSSCASTGL